MKLTVKAALADALIAAGVDVLDHLDDLGIDVDPGEAAAVLATWLAKLPTKQWNERLPRVGKRAPKPDAPSVVEQPRAGAPASTEAPTPAPPAAATEEPPPTEAAPVATAPTDALVVASGPPKTTPPPPPAAPRAPVSPRPARGFLGSLTAKVKTIVDRAAAYARRAWVEVERHVAPAVMVLVLAVTVTSWS